MCVFLCMFRLLASLACCLEFQMHVTPKRIWNETIKNKKKKTNNGTKTHQNWRFDAWAVLDTYHSVKPSGATQKMVRRTPTPVRSLRSRKIRRTRKPARSLDGVACCREVFSSLATLHDQMIKLLSPSKRFFFDSFTLSNFFFFFASSRFFYLFKSS